MNHIAVMRKYAFMTKEMTATGRKKMLFRKRELINQEETAGRHSQEPASSCLKSDDEVQNDGIHDEGCESDGDIDESHGDSFDKWMVCGCLLNA